MSNNVLDPSREFLRTSMIYSNRINGFLQEKQNILEISKDSNLEDIFKMKEIIQSLEKQCGDISAEVECLKSSRFLTNLQSAKRNISLFLS